jgi:GAF domain-containing protein/CheY-like chemotaxis protein/two-component sensor histidine kinase
MAKEGSNLRQWLIVAHIERPGRKAALVLAAWVTYALGFTAIYPRMGSIAAALAILPVLVTCWSLGTLAGVLAGLLVFPGNVVLTGLAGGTGREMMDAAGLLGSALLVLIGAVAGQLRDSRERLSKELAERERMEEALQRQNARLRTLNSLSQTLASSLGMEEMVETALSQTVELLGAAGGFIALIDEDTGRLDVTAQVGMPDGWIEQEGDAGLQTTLCELIPKNGDAAHVQEERESARIGGKAMLKMGFQSSLGVPIVHGEERLGALCVFDSRLYAADGPARTLLTTISQQLGVSIGKARLFRETAYKREVAHSLLDTAEILSTTLRFDQLLERVLDQLQQIVPYDTAAVILVQDEHCQIAASRGLDSAVRGQMWPLRDRPHIELVARERRLLALSEIEQRLTNGDRPEEPTSLNSWLGVPLVAQDKVVGVLTMGSSSRAIDEEGTKRVASAFAHQAGLAIENSRLYEQMRSQLRDVTILQEVTAAISSTLDVDQVLPYVAHSLCEILNGTSVEIFSLDESGRVATAVASYAAQRAAEAEQDFEAGREEPLEVLPGTAEALNRNRPIQMQLGDTDLDAHARARLKERDAQSMLLLPIVTHNRALGFSRVWDSGMARRFTRREIATGQTLAHQTAFAMENAHLFEQTRASLMETRALYRTSRSLIAQKSLDDVLQTVVDEVVEALAADRATVITFDLEGNRVKDYVKGGPGADHVVRTSFDELWNGLSGWVLRELRPALSAKGDPDPRENGRARRRRRETNCGSIVVVPLIYRGRPLGTMTAINRPEQRDFTEKDVDLMVAFANQAATALENARLLEETQRRANRLAGAADIARHATAIMDQEQLLEVVVDLIREQFGFRLASVFLIDETSDELYPAAATEDFWEMVPDRYRQPMGRGAIGKAAHDGRTVLVTDAGESAGENASRNAATLRVEGWHSPCSMSVPIQIGGAVLGVLQVEADAARAFDENDQLALEIIADQIAIAYENAELLAETRSRMTDLQLLHDVSLAAASSSHLRETLQAAAEALATEWKGTQIALQLIDEERSTLRMKASVGYPTDGAGDLDLPLGEGITGWVAEHGEAVLASDVGEDPRYYAANPATRSELCVPLTTGGKVIGTLNVESSQVDAFSPDDQRLLTTLASNLAILIERARLFDEVETARAESEQRAGALEGANARLKELDRLKSQFLANMSHELRTPLNSVIGFSEVLIDGLLGEMPPEQKECVENIYVSGEHLMALINDVLDLSKIEAGHMELAPETFDVRKVMQDVEKTVKPMFGDKSQILTIDHGDDLPALTADRVRLRQVLLNLLSNAHKFTPAEHEITLSCGLADQATMVFSVMDTGIGIKPEDQEIIFEEFRQADGSAGREVEGTGLGLAISKRLVEMHGGSIWLESEYGQGATFSFLLPLDGPSSSEDGVKDGSEAKETDVSTNPPVLLVGSDRAFVNLLAVYLRKAGYDPIQQYDGGGVPEQARELSPLLIILDVKLAQKEGWDILRRLKSDPETDAIPVALISPLEDGKKALSLGTGEYVTSSVDQDGLETLISRFTTAEPTKILVMEDGIDVAPRLRKTLSEDGYSLVPAYDYDDDEGQDDVTTNAGARDRLVFALRGRNGRSQKPLADGNGALTPKALAKEIQRLESGERCMA